MIKTSVNQLFARSILISACSITAIFQPAWAKGPEPMTVDQAIVKAAMQRQHKNGVQALATLRAVEAKAGNNASFYAERAAAYIENGELKKALPDTERAIALNPNLSDAHDRRAYCLAMKGDVKGAIAEYTKVIKLNPNSPKPYHNRGLAYKELGKMLEAGKDLEKYEQMQTILARREQEAAVLDAADKQVKEGRVDTAIGALEAANKAFPMAGVAYNLGLLYRDKNNYPKAIKAFDQAIQLGAKDQEHTSSQIFALFDKGLLQARLKKYKEAAADYTDLITRADKGHPVNSVTALLKEYKKLALGERAKSYLLMNKLDNAMADCTKLLALNPNAGVAFQVRSAVYQLQGKKAEAAKDQAQAKKYGLTAAIDTSILLSSPEAGYRKAYDELSEVIKEHPRETHPLRDRGFLSMHHKFYKSATEDFTAVLAKTPNDTSALLARGECYFNMSQFDESTADFQQVIKLDPQKAQSAYVWKARIFEKLHPKDDPNQPRPD